MNTLYISILVSLLRGRAGINVGVVAVASRMTVPSGINSCNVSDVSVDLATDRYVN